MSDYRPPPAGRLEPHYCDDHLLVIDKPAGLLAVPGRGEHKQDCLSTRLLQEFPDALVVHRLDMATSGLLLFARGIVMQRRLSGMFRERQIEKCYQAIVEGAPLDDAGSVDLPIATDWPNRPRRKIDSETGKPSLTRYRVSERYQATSRMELEPVTGRTHQLRIHMMAIGHPIVGDELYCGRPAERLMLHAASLSFRHPVSGIDLHCFSEPPF